MASSRQSWRATDTLRALGDPTILRTVKRLSAFPAPTPPFSPLAHPARSPEWGLQEVRAGGPGNPESRQAVSLALASTQLVLPPKIISVTGLSVKRWNRGDKSRRKIAGYSKADQRKEKGGEIWKENGIPPAFLSGPRSKYLSALSLEVRGRSHPCSQLTAWRAISTEMNRLWVFKWKNWVSYPSRSSSAL